MFKTLKRWLVFKDKEDEALVKLLETSSNDAKVGNTISGEEMLAKLKDQPPKAPTNRSVRGDRHPPDPYFVEPDRSYNSSRDCGSSYDSSSSSSDSCSSSFN